MRAFLSKAKTAIAAALDSAPVFVALAGAGLVSYGVALIYEPAGVIVGGILLVVAALDMGS